MRLIDKDKLLRELIENPKYEDIRNLDDAIEAVKYADEVDLSKIQADERAKTIDEFAQNLKLKTHMENRLIDILAEQMKGKSNINRQADEIDLSEHDKQIKRQTLNAFISFANKHVFDEDRELDSQITSAIKWVADEISKAELPQLNQSLPTIGEEKIPFGKTSLIKEIHDWPVDNKDPSSGHNYWFVNDVNSKVHILMNNAFIDISFEAGALYKNHTFFASSYHLNNKEALTRIAENIFNADQNMSLQDWLNDYKTVFARAINDELCSISSTQTVEDVQADLKNCSNEHDDEEEDGFDPGDDD